MPPCQLIMARPPPDPPSQLFIENLLKSIYVWVLMLLSAPGKVIYIWPDLSPSLPLCVIRLSSCADKYPTEFREERQNINISLKSPSLDRWFCYGCYGGLEGIIFSLINNNNTQLKSKILHNQFLSRRFS